MHLTLECCELQKDEGTHLHQFILHAALDIVQDALWTTNAMCAPDVPVRNLSPSFYPVESYTLFMVIVLLRFLKVVDKFNDLLVSVYVSAGHILPVVYLHIVVLFPSRCGKCRRSLMLALMWSRSLES